MKKILAILLVVLMLTGCVAQTATTGNTTTTVTTESTQTTTEPTTEATEPATEPTEPATEPTTEATEPATEPTTETTEPATEPTTEATEPVEEPDPYPYTCGGHETDPYADVDVDEFYANYTTACCYVDACYRTEHYLLSGFLEIPELSVTVAEDRPTDGDSYVRNTEVIYMDDGNTSVLLDSQGQFVTYIFRGAAYITLEEVAAYMFAFGGSDDSLPANYDSNKKASPASSGWGKYLRVNHSNFTGDTTKYPKEPELPNITGIGGDLYYYEMDIGTSTYNNGNKISRGMARLVYARYDLNNNGVIDDDEVYVFYTCNHYNDFQEYLNYYNGWGDMFGYNTGLSMGMSSPSARVEPADKSLREHLANAA